MFLKDSRRWSTARGEQRAKGPFLALFSKTAGGEIRCCVRSVSMRQLGHFMTGRMEIKSHTARKENDSGPLPSHPSPEYYIPKVQDGRFVVYVEGTYGDNGLTIDVDPYPGLWEVLHPLPVDLTIRLWKDKNGWNSSGDEGPSIHEWASNNIKELRRLFMDDTTALRKAMANEINTNPGTREDLEALHGQVWDTDELQRDFSITAFRAPFVVVKRKSDDKEGTIQFQHHPRLYWGFQEK